jgi:predicted XRE-type DNA-binding protein
MIDKLDQLQDASWLTAAGAMTAISITTEDLTGPVAALVILVAIGIAVWRGAGVLFRAWLEQCKLDRKERVDRHMENLRLHQHNADQMKTLIESQQLAQLETARAVRENAASISHLSDTFRGKICWAEKDNL